MPMFKVKDLMVHIEPTGTQALCLHNTRCGGCTLYISCGPLTPPIGCHPCSLFALTKCAPDTRWCHGCTFEITYCLNGTRVDCHATIPPTWTDPISPVAQLSPVIEQLNPEGLAVLKAQLQETLDKVDAQQVVLNQQLAPQTLEDANLLEEKLNTALTEVRALKTQLKKG